MVETGDMLLLIQNQHKLWPSPHVSKHYKVLRLQELKYMQVMTIQMAIHNHKEVWVQIGRQLVVPKQKNGTLSKYLKIQSRMEPRLTTGAIITHQIVFRMVYMSSIKKKIIKMPRTTLVFMHPMLEGLLEKILQVLVQMELIPKYQEIKY